MNQTATSENLNNSEMIFFHLLADDKLFNQEKFLKSLKQEKQRRINLTAEYKSRSWFIKKNSSATSSNRKTTSRIRSWARKEIETTIIKRIQKSK